VYLTLKRTDQSPFHLSHNRRWSGGGQLRPFASCGATKHGAPPVHMCVFHLYLSIYIYIYISVCVFACVLMHACVCTVQTWVQSAAPKKYFSFTLPHQPRTLKIFNLHQPRTGIFCLTGSKIRQKFPFFNPAPPK
jgi:hypothetical protein